MTVEAAVEEAIGRLEEGVLSRVHDLHWLTCRSCVNSGCKGMLAELPGSFLLKRHAAVSQCKEGLFHLRTYHSTSTDTGGAFS